MKKTGGIINAQLSRVIAELGHKDLLVVSDAGLPVPGGVERVDLAIVPMLPRFLDVVKAIVNEIAIESIAVSKETLEYNPQLEKELLSIVPDVEVRYVSHAELKEMTKGAKAIVRSAEYSPYANVVITAGCSF